MTTIEALENRKKCLAYMKNLGPRASKENMEAVELSVIALEEKLAREKAEAALTAKGEHDG